MAEMPSDELAELSRAIALYQLGRPYEIQSTMVKAVFEMIKSQFERDDEKYEETCRKRSAAGQASAESKSQQKPTNVNTCQQKPTLVDKSQQKPTNVDEYEYEYVSDNEKETLSKESAKKKPAKRRHHTHVLLTEDEYERLKADYGEEKTEAAIKYLDDYISEKGYKSKSHNLTLRRWVFDALDERKDKTKAPRSGTTQWRFEGQRDDYDYEELARKMAVN